jgi:enoyl-[acyl-carrier-protein] reductase (NADH)
VHIAIVPSLIKINAHSVWRASSFDARCDVGVATAFLSRDAARLITSKTLYVDGGYHIID